MDQPVPMRLISIFIIAIALSIASVQGQEMSKPERIYSGIWKFTIGISEKISPVNTRHFLPAAESLEALPQVDACPVSVSGSTTPRGTLVSVPLEANEMVYGLGLQLMSFQQRAKKKMLRVNADPAMDSGDSHAPVPCYVTSNGYGVLIDTARYATFYIGNKSRRPNQPPAEIINDGRNDGWNGVNPYERSGFGESSEVLVEIPRAAGVDVYVFAGQFF